MEKYMGVEYSINSVGNTYKWSVADGNLFGSGFSENRKKAKETAERWIKSAKKN